MSPWLLPKVKPDKEKATPTIKVSFVGENKYQVKDFFHNYIINDHNVIEKIYNI